MTAGDVRPADGVVEVPGADDVPVFDVCGPLPQGTVVLEASAGTGKTTTIASLAVRYVAEGVATLPELMLVTFGRAATAELRDRVRARFVEVERALRAPGGEHGHDAVVRHLADVDPVELGLRRDRLTRALAELDAATITTTHGFCQQMLAVLGTAGDVDHDAALLPDVADLESEVVDDLYLRKYASSDEPVLTVPDARVVAHEAVSDHAATLRPADAEPGSRAQHRFGLAAAARDELERRKRVRRVVDYDDLLVLLRRALAAGSTGAAAVERVRGPYKVVMVDEFQDTDPVQWDILRTAFHGSRTLVLIGDPKQAIYAFRGADVATYLRAAREGRTQTLGRNWRTDAPVLDGLAHVLGGAALGDPRIVVRPVDAGLTGRRLDGGPPVRLRQVTRDAAGAEPGKLPSVGRVRALLYRDVAAEVVTTLRTTRLRDTGAPDAPSRPVRPADVAVLVRTNAEALAVHDALTGAGVAAVISGLASVFGSPSARDWLTLLTALTRTGDGRLAAAAALTPFVGWDATTLALASDDELDGLADVLRGWAHVLEEHGVAALLEATAAAGLRRRLMAADDGERRLTDLRHVGEALHGAALDGGLGPAALTEWLRARMDEAARDYAEERSRRLETDAAAVQVITVHASKGLQFPVVLVPFAWNRWSPRKPDVLHLHDGDERVLHVGGPGSPGYDAALPLHEADEAGEDLRLAYVALTRAHSQVVLWWAPSANSSGAALTRLLLAPRDAAGTPAQTVKVPTDSEVTRRFAALADGSGGTLVHEVVDAMPDVPRWTPPAEPEPELHVAALARPVDVTWRRTSYSGLTAHAHHAGVGDEPEAPGVQDEPEEAAGATAAVPADPLPALRAVPSPMTDLPGGTAFGTLVHELLEHVDTEAADLRAELERRSAETGLSPALGVGDGALADALLPALRTPLGPLAGGRTLADIAPRDRLTELEFELPLAGGDLLDGVPAVLGDVADLLRAHLDAGDPFAGYADRLDGDLASARLRGYLTGSIDAVLRVPTDDGHRHLVVDYKTNRLGPHDEPLTAWHYRPSALVDAMESSHYPLQALLYSAALHRYLRWRLRGYDPDAHLGGTLYLFVRGMTGPDAPVAGDAPTGVMSWRPPSALVVALSDLLAGATS